MLALAVAHYGAWARWRPDACAADTPPAGAELPDWAHFAGQNADLGAVVVRLLGPQGIWEGLRLAMG
eukprot:12745864-Alexandrium_andersonii.AAC.1